MEMIICLNCGKHVYHSYHGFCSVMCCMDFAAKHNLSLDEVISPSHVIEINELQEEIQRLDNSCGYLQDDNSSMSNELEDNIRTMAKLDDDKNDLEKEIFALKKQIDKLRILDWEQIEKERNEEILLNANLKEDNRNIDQENKDLIEQNEDLLNTIKRMRHHSRRFQLLDLENKVDE
jgi:hypothetical protein